jgi:hypothetical protein
MPMAPSLGVPAMEITRFHAEGAAGRSPAGPPPGVPLKARSPL